MIRYALTRQTRWCQIHCSIFSNTGVITEKLFCLKMSFFTFRDLWVLMPKGLILGDIWGLVSERTFQELSDVLHICCSSYRDRDNADNMKPCHITLKYGCNLTLVTCGDLLTWTKKYWNSFLTRALMGSSKGPPCRFSWITRICLGVSLWNFQFLSGHQFYVSSKNVIWVTQGQTL